jgi:UDP-N-acetylmuramyl pentapeptide phosphotransferase/UDP-N-acetylglucosamine-1-phosphate transferase
MDAWAQAAVASGLVAIAGAPLVRRRDGGIVVLAAGVVGVLAGREFGDPGIAVLAGAAVLAVTGATSRGWVERAATPAAALAVTLAGVRAETTGLAVVDGLVTFLLVLAVVHAFGVVHRVDGAGLALATPTLVAIAALAVASRQADVAVVAAAAAGALFGLAPHNLPPATSRLGPLGGRFVGVAVAVSGIALATPRQGSGNLTVPALLVGLPVAAAALAGVASRRRRGVHAAALDERLVSRGLTPARVVAVLLGASTVGAGLAWAVGTDRVAWPVAAAVGGLDLLCVLLAAGTARAHDVAPTGFSRRTRVAAIGLLVVTIALAAPAVLALVRARSALEQGRSAAQAGLDAARQGDADAAHADFTRAAALLDRAHGLLGSPLVSMGRVVPVLGPNITAVRAVTDIGLDLAGVGRDLADHAGAKSLHVVDGRFPIDDVRALSGQLDHALATLDSSVATLDGIDGPFIAGPVRTAVATLDDRIRRTTDQTATAAEAARLAPALFGGDRPRRYFLAVVTPTELRGSGGIIGSFGIITIDAGKIELDQLDTIEVLNRQARKAPLTNVLPAVYRSTYSGFGGGFNFQNLTVTPDFPTAAAAIEAAYQAMGNPPVDGVISVDPIGLAGILKITGPVKVPPWPDPIKASNAEQILLLDQYVQLSGATRDAFLGDVAHAVFDKLTKGSLPAPTEIARALSDAVAGGHIHLQSTTPDEQALFARIHGSGALAAPGDDTLALVTQNGSASKIDYFLHRSMAYDVTVDPTSGAALATATITLRNDAPSAGLPEYILGSPEHGIVPGDNHIYVSLYSALAPAGVTIDGQSTGANVSAEAGRIVTTVVVVVPAGATRTVRIDLTGTLSRGSSYVLDLDHQPVINLDHVEVHLHAPVERDWSMDLATPAELRSDG